MTTNTQQLFDALSKLGLQALPFVKFYTIAFVIVQAFLFLLILGIFLTIVYTFFKNGFFSSFK